MNCLYLLIYFSQRVINEGSIKYLLDILLARGKEQTKLLPCHFVPTLIEVIRSGISQCNSTCRAVPAHGQSHSP